MANLIPEIRTDKNGKQTTRWVKPGWAAAPAKNVPVVQLQAAPVHRKLFSWLNGGDARPREGLREVISRTVTPERAKQLIDLMEKKKDSRTELFDLRRQITMCIENPKQGERLLPRLIAHADTPIAQKMPASVLMGLGGYGRDLTYDQEVALLIVTDAASYIDQGVESEDVGFPFDSYVLKNKELFALTMNHVDRAGEIAEIISTRKTDNHEIISDILNGGTHSSLVTGTL